MPPPPPPPPPPRMSHPESGDEEDSLSPPPNNAARREGAPNLPSVSGMYSHSDLSSTRDPRQASTAMTHPSDHSDDGQRALPFSEPAPREAFSAAFSAAPSASSPPSSSPYPSSHTNITIASRTSILTPTSGAADGTSPSAGINGSSSQQSPAGGSSFYGHGSWATPVPPGSYGYSGNNSTSGAFQRPIPFNFASPLSHIPRSSAVLQFSRRRWWWRQWCEWRRGARNQRCWRKQRWCEWECWLFGSLRFKHAFPLPGITITVGSCFARSRRSGPGSTSVVDESRFTAGRVRVPFTSAPYYPTVSSPQQGTFPYASQPGPSPNATGGPLPGRNPLGPLMPGMHSPIYAGSHRPHHQPPATYPPYPSMQGSMMTNLHQPNQPMVVYGHVSHPYPIHNYAGYHHPQPPLQERPFKCDQCNHSFNRNHDLKRHSRIHLAVKPFPCDNCERTFSRKDALKVCVRQVFFFWLSISYMC
ncbi:uncharacterized protein PODANS_1_19300 [Podospora anserina S mat+]|uniref:Podospora anserina S mat+ genomic DNA chromosome 1, supercontig 4 n=1 Tax=Podospora anserina (strain S / ATCC MYA-4624 / DSM 980 / FGSC 10383) TaxID=515849 RepID=B2AUJ1_PODAN|nr:uncharacterized protein PODANS_1_19300 [Podospora anserina S mat+]CAP68064.1 unnamed protein product [Podospora anserina S mat+]